MWHARKPRTRRAGTILEGNDGCTNRGDDCRWKGKSCNVALIDHVYRAVAQVVGTVGSLDDRSTLEETYVDKRGTIQEPPEVDGPNAMKGVRDDNTIDGHIGEENEGTPGSS